jgi:hypothetical protein
MVTRNGRHKINVLLKPHPLGKKCVQKLFNIKKISLEFEFFVTNFNITNYKLQQVLQDQFSRTARVGWIF